MAEHAHAPGHSHMKDFEAHVTALEADLEYYRTKRLESRIIFLHRRGVVTFYDVLRAYSKVKSEPRAETDKPDPHDFERRIRALEDGLDEYVRGVAIARDSQMVIEDGRKERGDYDPSFRISKKHREGTLEERIEQLERDLSDYALLLEAFTRALVDNGVVTREVLERRRAELLSMGSDNGARIVARAWVDPEFKEDLLTNGREAVRALGIPPGRLGKLGVAENTESVHNVVVCTLCSCYPADLLGDPPWWYKQETYREGIVRNPRGLLQKMFELNVPDGMEIRVHDSTSDIRWMVLPRRPAGTEGMTEAELARLVTAESLIGTGEPLQPSEALASASPAAQG